jgi:hypothetical protein
MKGDKMPNATKELTSDTPFDAADLFGEERVEREETAPADKPEKREPANGKAEKPKKAVAKAEKKPECPSGPLCFDIETGPEPEERLRDFFEVDYTKVKGADLIDAEFDSATVKLGQMKDPLKIAAKIDGEREKFEAAKAAAIEAKANAATVQWREFVDRAALSPITGRVLAIGWIGTNDVIRIEAVDPEYERAEAELLAHFWASFRDSVRIDAPMIGFNSHGFDLPFLVRRSWLLGVDVPDDVLANGRPHRLFIDLMQVWQCGNRQERIGLNALSAFFGHGQKTEGVDGGDFARLYLSEKPEDRETAIDYLRQDCRLTLAAAKRMGVV